MDLSEPTFVLYFNVVVSLLVIPFWFVRMVKGILFYVYLWQLKEYHIGRFLDHFRTEKGRQLVLNKAVIGKGILFVLGISFLALAFYMLEAMRFVYDLLMQRVRGPVATKKAKVLMFLNVGLVLIFSVFVFQGIIDDALSDTRATRILLAVDLLSPIGVSAIILAFQPLAVIGRNRIIQKAKEKRAKLKKLKVIGITGSYGKTTTKEILAHILSQKFNVMKTPEHKNSEVGISQVVLGSLTDIHEIFVCEMGAYNKGGIKMLVDIVKPDIGIVTGVNEQHLATFGSMENLLSAEGGEELVNVLPKDGVVILNGDNRYCRDLYKKTEKPKKILCNTFDAIAPNMLVPKTDIWTEDVNVEKEKISFRVMVKNGERANFEVNLIGRHNVENILLAVAAAEELGMSLQEIVKACESITQEMGAMKLKRGINGLNIIDSMYSANPDGVIAALEYLKVWKGRKVIVMPCLIELGKASKEVHKRIGEKIGEVCDLAIITTKDWFNDLKQGAISKGMEEGQILFQEDPQKIFDMVKNINQEEDAILLESRVPSRLLELVND